MGRGSKSAAVAALTMLLLALSATPGAAQFETTKRWLAERLANLLGGPGITVDIGSVDGLVPFDVTLHDVTVADPDGIFLTVKEATLDWSPAQLARGRLRVERVAVGEATLRRPPNLPEEPPPPDDSGGFRLPSLPIHVEVRSLSLRRLVLEEPVLGEAAAFAAEGRLDLPRGGGNVDADLSARRLDQPAILTAKVDYAADSGRLALNLDFEEPEGGLIARQLQLPGAPGVRFHLAGDGPASAWQGRLQASAGDLVDVNAGVGIGGLQPFEMSLQGQAAVAPALAGPYAPLLQPAVSIELRASLDRDSEQLTVRHADLATSTMGITLSGSAMLDGSSFDLDLAARAPQLAPVAAPFGLEAAGLARLNGTLTGSLRRPAATARLHIADGRIATLSFTDATVDAAAEAPAAANTVALDVDGAVTQPRLDGQPIAGIGQRLTLDAAASLDPAAGDIEVTRLELAGEQARVSGTAAIAEWAEQVKATLQLAVPQLAPLAGGTPLTGAATVTAQIDGAPREGRVSATVNGGLDRLSTGIPAADAALGAAPHLSAEIRWDDRLTVETATIEGRHLSLSAKGSLPADFSTVAATLRARLPDIAPVAAAAGAAVVGEATVMAQVSGPLAAPVVEGQADFTDLQAAGTPLPAVQLDWHARDLANSPAGRVTAALKGGDVSATLATAFALNGDRLQLSDLTLRGPGLSGGGGIAVDLAGPALDGAVELRADDIASLARLAGAPLRGAATASLRLRPTAGGQSATLRLASDGFGAGADAVTVKALQLTAVAQNVLADPTGTVDVSVRGLSAGAAGVERGTLSGHLAGDTVRFEASAEGEAGQPFDVSLAGTAEPFGQSQRLVLNRLDGTVAGQPLTLREPLRFERSGDSLRLADFGIDFAGGSIVGALAVEPERLDGRLTVRSLPLRLAEIAVPSVSTSGTLDARLDLAGRPQQPAITLAATAEGVRIQPRLDGSRPADDVPPFTARLSADWQDGHLQAEAGLDGIPGSTAEAAVGLPLILAGDGSLHIPAGEAVSGRLTVDSALAELAAVLPVGEDRYAGHLQAQVSLAGRTGGGELVDGALTLADGYYESFVAGTILRDLDLRLVGRDERLVIESLSATDGNSGRLSGDGTIVADPQRGFPVDLQLRFNDFRAVRRDEADATVGGDLALRGGLGSPTLSGRIELQQAEIRIPGRLPAGISEVEVVQVNLPDDAGAATEPETALEETAPPLAEVLKLDLAVTAPARVFVRGRGLTAEWSGNLKIDGTAAEPTIQGSIDLVRGDFDLAGKIFELKRGTARFSGGPTPDIDVMAEYAGADITARVIIQGSVADPQITLESTPALPQEEILSRVLFGQSVGSLSPLQLAQLTQAALTLSGRLGSGGIFDRLRRQIGLDRLEVRSEGEGLAGNTLSAGKYVSDRVYVGVEQGITADSSRVRVEIQVLPSITLESRVGVANDNQIGLNWRWDY